MMKQSRRRSTPKPRYLTLPELDQSKTSVLNTLGSLQSRRSYQHAMDEFIDWYCSEPRLALNRIVVLRYRMHLESVSLAPATINLRLAAVRTGLRGVGQWLAQPRVGGRNPPRQRPEK